MTVLSHAVERGTVAVHPLLIVGLVSSTGGVLLSSGATNYNGIATLILSIAGLVTAIGGIAVTLLRMYLDARRPDEDRPKRRR